MLLEWLKRHIEWSGRTFGHGVRTKGLCNHIRKELIEIEEKPHDLKEWIDVATLAFDGAWRSGYTADQIIDAFMAKQVENMKREWPTNVSDDTAIEHIRPKRFEAEQLIAPL